LKKDQIVGRLIKENDAHNPSHCRTFLFWSIWIGYKHIMCGEHNWLLLCNNCLRAWLFAWDWTFQHIFCALFLSLCAPDHHLQWSAVSVWKPTKKHVVDYLVGGPPCTMVALILLSDRLSFCLFGTVSYLSGFYYLNYYSPIEGKWWG